MQGILNKMIKALIHILMEGNRNGRGFVFSALLELGFAYLGLFIRLLFGVPFASKALVHTFSSGRVSEHLGPAILMDLGNILCCVKIL